MYTIDSILLVVKSKPVRPKDHECNTATKFNDDADVDSVVFEDVALEDDE